MTIERDSDRLIVAAGTVLSGYLDRSQVKRDTSIYSYQAVPPKNAVSLIMPVRRDPYLWQQGVHPIFEMNLPEGELRQALIRKFAKVQARFDDFDLLSIVGPHQLGRVTVLKPEMDNNGAPMAMRDLLHYAGTEDLVEYLLSTYAPYSGVSGVQPKVLMRDPETEGVDRLTQRTATHIVKAWRDDQYPQLAANEYFCLLAARSAGLPVPDFDLSDDGRLLIIKRFDLPVDGTYLGFEDLCALNGWLSNRKYEGSYEHCAKQLRTFVSPDRRRSAMEQFYASLVLSCVLQNGDAHRKNFGVLYSNAADDADVWIAPTYDIVTTTAYIPKDALALLLAGSKRWPKERILRQFGRTACDLSAGSVAVIMERIGDGIATARAALTAYARDNPPFQPVAEKMLQAWNCGQKQSLLDERRPMVSLGSNMH